MIQVILRDLPGVSTVETQLDMQFRERLLDDELEELPHLIDETSRHLFGITQGETFYSALPHHVSSNYSRVEWEGNFDVLGQYTRDPNAHWREFAIDIRCEHGATLHCFEVFGRQLVCALHGLHPRAVLAFAVRKPSQAA